MPEARLARARATLPEGYQYQPGPCPRCFACKLPVIGLPIYLATDIGDDQLEIYTFHAKCADAPWPLFQVVLH